MHLFDRNSSKSFETHYKKHQDQLRTRLLELHINEGIIEDLCTSGYYMLNFRPNTIFDSFYGTKWAFKGQFELDHLLKNICEPTDKMFAQKPQIYSIANINEIEDILTADDRSQNYWKNGYFSFRGQRTEYTTKRKFPNPTMSDEEGNERLIMPSCWRPYKDDFNKRNIDADLVNIFAGNNADDIIFHGIPDYQNIPSKYYERHGYYTIAELVDSDDPAEQAYYQRYWELKANADYNPELAIVLQHYGFDTTGLDITFDPRTAGFFATQRYELQENGKVEYFPIQTGDHKGVVYCFYFRDPGITSTKSIIEKLPTLQHLHPLRPLRQQCALPFFLFNNFNEAPCYLYAVFYLNHDFDTTGLPAKEYLFPNRSEDPFYDAVLHAKARNSALKSFAEYAF